MSWFECCDKRPYTISIQFNYNDISFLSKDIQNCGLNNRISHHISIKYLGYEDDLFPQKTQDILDVLYKNRLKFNKKTIDIVGFDIMNLNNSYYKDHLYLKLEPISYLNALHKSIISFLDGMIDMFIMNDLKNFVPHISCGKISDSRKIEFLNYQFNKHGTIHIDNWELVLHTSKQEFVII